MSSDLIVGSHSIVEALLNENRAEKTLVGVESSVKEFKKAIQNSKILNSITVELIKNNHVFQQEAEKLFKEFGFKFSRVPGNILLVCSKVPFSDWCVV